MSSVSDGVAAGLEACLSQTERAFIEKRRRLLRWWPVAATVLLLGLLSLALWMYWQSPLLIDPRVVAVAIQEGRLADDSLALMALLLPVMVLTLLALMLVFVLLGFAIFRNEARYLEMLSSCCRRGAQHGSNRDN